MPDSLQSMTQWATQTHTSSAGGATNAQLQQRARTLYDTHSPGSTQLSQPQQMNHLLSLQQLHADPTVPVQVYPQGNRGESPAQYMLRRGFRRAAHKFSYRIMPLTGPINSRARITLNINPQRSQQVSQAMARELVSNRSVRQTKMMGPDRLGQRTDDAIMYMRHHSFRTAQRTARRISQRVNDPTAFVQHTPYGMEPIPGMPGMSYSEAHPALSSSHGTARKQIIANAVESFRTLGGHRDTDQENMAGHIGYHAYRMGFNPNAPAFVVKRSHKRLLQSIRDYPTQKRNANIARITGTSTLRADAFAQRVLRAHGLR
ncbi:T3SS effector HopA1 family protein [Zooshikella sp. RANM57]|uniref:T3SS effector HopA1 family protein n=1 Tax=Zooshikella sp. RANM57 TaxID=3425863 RepID=UPI003D6F87CF